MSAFGGVRASFIPSRVKPMTLKLVCIASRLDVQHYRDSVENKPASLLVLPLSVFNGILQPRCDIQTAGNS